jgi:hypothetical protein
MKRLSILLMIVALLVMNLAGVAHADCIGEDCDTIVLSAGDSHGNDADVDCGCCASSHHHTNIFVPSAKADFIASTSLQLYEAGGATFLSQLHYPPSKPPKA